jgi:hypothetical protein
MFRKTAKIPAFATFSREQLLAPTTIGFPFPF